MPCMCGDDYCQSCGMAQGNSKCPVCGRWSADGGCKDPARCEAEMKKWDQAYADDLQWERDHAEEICQAIRITCPRCGGSGYQALEEDGRQVQDACYHCGATGWIDDQQYFANRVSDVASRLAAHIISAQRKAMDSDPDGEGWDFYAAENGMRGYDMYQVEVGCKSDRLCDWLKTIERDDPELLRALVDLINSEDEETCDA